MISRTLRIIFFRGARLSFWSFSVPKGRCAGEKWLFLVAATLIGVVPLHSQEYMWTTLAGAGGPGSVDGPASSARFNYPQAVAADAFGNIFVADSLNETIRRIDPAGSVSTVAGIAPAIGASDGIGAGARFYSPVAMVLDTNRNIYIADQYNHTIRKISTNGLVATFAGAPGQAGAADGNGPDARFSFPSGIAIDSSGNLFVADTANQLIRKVTPNGDVTTIAGTAGKIGLDDGTGPDARFNYPGSVAVGVGGVLYVADTGNNTIRKITPDGSVTTLAGSAGQPGSSDGSGAEAIFSDPVSVATDPSGNIYVADSSNNSIRKVTPDGIVSTVAGDPTPADPNRPLISYADGAGRNARFKFPSGVAIDLAGNILVADSGNNAVRRINNGVVSTIAGPAKTGADDGPAANARFRHPTGVAVNEPGAVFVVDGDNDTVRRITGGVVSTIAGTAQATGTNDGIGLSARFNGPRKTSFDHSGNLILADTVNGTLRKLTETGKSTWLVSTLAGQPGNDGYADGAPTDARFNAPYDVASDRSGNLYVADQLNHVIRKIAPDATASLFAGIPGIPGGADGSFDIAQFNAPHGLTVDTNGNIYVADTLNHAIRKITPDGDVSTLAGQPGFPGAADGTTNQARFAAPYGIEVDSAGTLFVADYSNNLIRKITPDGTVRTIGGQIDPDTNGNPLNGSADGPGAAARFFNPKDIAVDSAGTIYVADSFNNAIRVGTTNFCPDVPTIDQTTAIVGQVRQLETNPKTAVTWQWNEIRRPANSKAALSAANVRNPTFAPDVADTYIFELRATNSAGATCVRRVALTATLPPPVILGAPLTSTNGQFSFTLQGTPGAVVQVQVTGTFTNWFTLGTFTLETNIFTVTDTGPDPKRAFYRLLQF